MNSVPLLVFVTVYLGMILGRVPGLALDRSGIALLGGIALVLFGEMPPEAAWNSIDVPTTTLLLGLMIISAQFTLGGFYTRVTQAIASADARPDRLLALLIVASAGLSALLANDIVCLAMAPVLVAGCSRRQLNPVPFLLALACASNVGSALTLIGNPQNMLIGQKLQLSFAGYLMDSAAPTLLGLGVVWWVIQRQFRDNWHAETSPGNTEFTAFNAWQTAKGTAVMLALAGVFLFTSWPRDVAALTAAGALLMSRRMATREMLALVDWHLLVLFAGLFIVNAALAESGWLAELLEVTRGAGVNLEQPAPLFIFTVVLSNLVSNVPATMLLLPTATHPLSGAILALASTLAGNLFIVGSIANIIVVEQAALLGIKVGWREHARTGVPVGLLTLGLAGGWLWLRAAWL